jgi:MFS family permease
MKEYKRNEMALTWQGILFFAGFAFIDPNAVIPVFVSSIGGSLAMAGLAVAVRIVPSILAQLFIGIHSGSIRNVPKFISSVMCFAYAVPLAIAAMLLIPAARTLALPLFFVLFGLMWMGDGSTVIPWYDMLGRCVEERRRGLILGWQQLFGGAAALGCSAVVRWVLGMEAIPQQMRFAILFIGASLFLMPSAIIMARVKDKPRRIVPQENPLRHIREFPRLFFGNRRFLHSTAVQACQGVAVMAIPFLILFSRQTFSLSAAQAAGMIPVQIAGGLLGGLVWGQVSHRLGNRRVIQINQCVIVLVMLLGLVVSLTHLMFPIYPLALLGGLVSSCWMGYPNYIMDITSAADRPKYLILSSLINLPFTFMPALCGILAQTLGFTTVFALCLCIAAVGVVLSLRLQAKSEEVLTQAGVQA